MGQCCSQFYSMIEAVLIRLYDGQSIACSFSPLTNGKKNGI